MYLPIFRGPGPQGIRRRKSSEGDEEGRAQQTLAVMPVLAQVVDIDRQQVTGVEDADDVVAVIIIDGHALHWLRRGRGFHGPI